MYPTLVVVASLIQGNGKGVDDQFFIRGNGPKHPGGHSLRKSDQRLLALVQDRGQQRIQALSVLKPGGFR
jgi:hypothetical protein